MNLKIIKKIAITLIAILLILFLVPLFLFGIINIGNATGIIVCTLILAYLIKTEAINTLIKKALEKTWSKVITYILGGCIGIIALLAIVLTILMYSAVFNKPLKNSTVVVLGCRVYGEKASIMLTERIDAAYDYLIENEDCYCILSGGQGDGENISEAECMYRELVDRGINPDRLFKEDLSTSTRENIAFSKDIIEANNLPEDIAIVTNEFHEYRAREIATAEELDAYSVPAWTVFYMFPTYYVRELYGILFEMIF